MLSSVLVLGLLTGLDPMRLGIALLVISRPRPVQNLIAYWTGCLTAFLPSVAVPLTLLHITPSFKSFMQNWASSSTFGHIQLAMGVLALSIAALITVRHWMRRRTPVPTPVGNTSARAPESNEQNVISRLLHRARDAAAEGGSPIRRLLGRVHNAWENGSLWVAVVIGFGFGGVAPELALLALTIIVTSGATIGAQVIAATGFVAGVLAVAEISIVSYVVAPEKTQAVLRPLHDWALAHRHHIVIGICAVGGISLLANGIGNI